MFGGLCVGGFAWNRWFAVGNIEASGFKTQRYNRTDPQSLGTVKK